MTFVHDDRDFDALLRIVADKRRISVGLVEKDYWVTHALWALQHAGFELWFKGGTSLSKGFGLIERFSEDLDLKLEPGRIGGIPPATEWKRDGPKVIAAREVHLRAMAAAITVPGAAVSLEDDLIDERWRSVNVRVAYPGKHLDSLSAVLRPFVLLEIGSARVTPSVACDMSAFVHEELATQRQLDVWQDNRPKQVRCVHPMVTLLEKIDALARRAPNPQRAPATFVRHYEDAARIIARLEDLPALEGHAGPRELAAEMIREKQIKPVPAVDHAAFVIQSNERTQAIRQAFEAIAPMYWGPRLTLDECLSAIQGWIREVGFSDDT